MDTIHLAGWYYRVKKDYLKRYIKYNTVFDCCRVVIFEGPLLGPLLSGGGGGGVLSEFDSIQRKAT